MRFSEHTKGRLLIVSTALLWGLAGVCVKSIPWSAFCIMSARCMICIVILAIDRRSLKMHITIKDPAWGGHGEPDGDPV